MIILLRNTSRRHLRQDTHETWSTFFPATPAGSQTTPDGSSTMPTGKPLTAFGLLVGFDEQCLSRERVEMVHPRKEGEVIVYVYKGALAQEDSSGRSGVVLAGEFQHCTIALGIHYKEKNLSRDDRARSFRISLHPHQAGLTSAREQKLFPSGQRRNLLCIIASPDGRKGSLPILQDAVICSSVLDQGHHLVHELSPGHSAWLHIICGQAAVQDLILTGGDGIGVRGEASLSFTAQQQTEILLVDLGPAPSFFERAASA